MEKTSSTTPACRQASAWRHASSRTQLPSGTINPVDSATSMNSAGREQAALGWCHRTNASAPIGAASGRTDEGLVEDLELALLDRVTKVAGDGKARARFILHLRMEELEAPLALLTWPGTWPGRRSASGRRLRRRACRIDRDADACPHRHVRLAEARTAFRRRPRSARRRPRRIRGVAPDSRSRANSSPPMRATVSPGRDDLARVVGPRR